MLASDVPLGSGLSSSAALEVALALALAGAAAWSPDPRALALACRDAEERATGVPCGIMDQLTSIVGQADSALLIDCRSLDIEPVRLPDRLDVLVVHSGLPRTLDSSAYADRRRACERLARELGVPALRDATPEQVRGEPLGRHVVSENERVLERGGKAAIGHHPSPGQGIAQALEAVHALGAADLTRFGRLLIESHTSLRDDYGVSTPELDVLVAALVDAGAFGAKLTGGGFGGCVVAACDAESTDAVADAATSRYRERTGCVPTAFRCRAVEGASAIEPPAT